MSTLQEIQAKRDARKADLAKQRDTQCAIDLEAVDALEMELGDSNVAIVEVPFTPGLPTLAAVKTPSTDVTKRYRARVKKEGADAAAAAEEVAAVTTIYPEASVVAEMVKARPGLLVQLGVAALGLATGKAAEEGKG